MEDIFGLKNHTPNFGKVSFNDGGIRKAWQESSDVYTAHLSMRKEKYAKYIIDNGHVGWHEHNGWLRKNNNTTSSLLNGDTINLTVISSHKNSTYLLNKYNVGDTIIVSSSDIFHKENDIIPSYICKITNIYDNRLTLDIIEEILVTYDNGNSEYYTYVDESIWSVLWGLFKDMFNSKSHHTTTHGH